MRRHPDDERATPCAGYRAAERALHEVAATLVAMGRPERAYLARWGDGWAVFIRRHAA